MSYEFHTGDELRVHNAPITVSIALSLESARNVKIGRFITGVVTHREPFPHVDSETDLGVVCTNDNAGHTVGVLAMSPKNPVDIEKVSVGDLITMKRVKSRNSNSTDPVFLWKSCVPLSAFSRDYSRASEYVRALDEEWDYFGYQVAMSAGSAAVLEKFHDLFRRMGSESEESALSRFVSEMRDWASGDFRSERQYHNALMSLLLLARDQSFVARIAARTALRAVATLGASEPPALPAPSSALTPKPPRTQNPAPTGLQFAWQWVMNFFSTKAEARMPLDRPAPTHQPDSIPPVIAPAAAPRAELKAPAWQSRLSQYPKHVALAFGTKEKIELVIDRLWDPHSPLYGVPRSLADGETLVVPEDAVPYFESLGIPFDPQVVMHDRG